MNLSEQLLSNEDVARILGVPVKTIEKWRYEGTGPLGFRLGRHVRYRAEEVQRWINEKAGVPDAAA